jgi:hypothetical protein
MRMGGIAYNVWLLGLCAHMFISCPERPDLFPNPRKLFVQLVPEGIFPGVKRSGRESDHVPAEVKNELDYTSPYPLPSRRLHGQFCFWFTYYMLLITHYGADFFCPLPDF